ncbi:MAG: Gfo/Idh/MocA family oxidoreductase [Cyclobacteriaceae bacterium]|nr:Gfo/Idh/MocA family oxidoreductase [Cyclobacteriaceae bacterium]
MSGKIKWGILGVANIAIKKVIPAMQKDPLCEVYAIASRDLLKAKEAAHQLSIPVAHGSYEALITDPEVQAVYIPLPNHLHVEWTAKAIQAGKHVLCEKPLSLRSDDLIPLMRLRDAHNVKVGEAFMVHTASQWIKAMGLIKGGELGSLKSIMGYFSYYKIDPENYRNKLDFGGGGVYDIGCYPVHMSRWAFNEEPNRVVSTLEYDPVMKIDRLASVIMEFPSGQSIFSCGTQIAPYQRMHFFGDKKRLEVCIPFNAPPDRTTEIILDEGGLVVEKESKIYIDPADQYTEQSHAFNTAIMEDTEVPVPLEDAYANMKVLDAIFASASTGGWVIV